MADKLLVPVRPNWLSFDLDSSVPFVFVGNLFCLFALTYLPYNLCSSCLAKQCTGKTSLNNTTKKFYKWKGKLVEGSIFLH